MDRICSRINQEGVQQNSADLYDFLFIYLLKLSTGNTQNTDWLKWAYCTSPTSSTAHLHYLPISPAVGCWRESCVCIYTMYVCVQAPAYLTRCAVWLGVSIQTISIFNDMATAGWEEMTSLIQNGLEECRRDRHPLTLWLQFMLLIYTPPTTLLVNWMRY